MRNWFMRLWRPRNPTICHMQTKDFKKAGGIKQSKFKDL